MSVKYGIHHKLTKLHATSAAKNVLIIITITLDCLGCPNW